MEQKITKITTGNYSFDLDVMPGEKVIPKIMELGYKVAIQSALMEWERQLAYPTVNGVKAKRPEKFKRKDIPFTKENADLLDKLVGAVKIDVSADDAKEPELADVGIMEVSNIALYEGTTYTPKYASEKQFVQAYLFETDGKTAKKLKDGTERTIETFCASKEIEVPTDPWQEDAEFLASVKAWTVAKLAEMNQ